MSWARANDGWFPRLFPALAAQLGMEPAPSQGTAAAAAAAAKPAAKSARQPAAASSARASG